MATYTYSVSTDFGGIIDSDYLHRSVNKENNMIPSLTGVTIDGDTVNIDFDAPLSSGEEATLNDMVNNHVPVEHDHFNKFFTITIRDNYTSNKTYTKLGSFIYNGSLSTDTFKRIIAASHMDSGATSYNLRVIDIENNKLLAEVTYNNTSECSKEMDITNNVPTDKSTIELHGRINSITPGLNLYVDSASVYF